MRVLVLGGTGFVGRHLAEQALARGHAVTVFHRGRSNPGCPRRPSTSSAIASWISPLAKRRFDVVVDTTGYEVRPVRAAARALAHPDLRYVFVSTISVYADMTSLLDGSRARCAPPTTPRTRPSRLGRYGALKAACEAALDEEPPRPRAPRARRAHPRPARLRRTLPLVAPARVARGGEVLAPGRPAAMPRRPSTCAILAAWMLATAERRLSGTFNRHGRADDDGGRCSGRRSARWSGATRASPGSTTSCSWRTPCEAVPRDAVLAARERGGRGRSTSRRLSARGSRCGRSGSRRGTRGRGCWEAGTRRRACARTGSCGCRRG